MNANIVNVGSNARIDRLLTLQRNAAFSPMVSGVCDFLREQERGRVTCELDIAKRLTKDELHRVAYLPFVIAEVVWDYADTLCDLAVIMRESKLKRLCRAVKELRRDYDRSRAPFLDAATQAKEEEHMIGFQEELNDFFYKMRLAVTAEIHTKHGHLESEGEMLVVACHMGVICFRALRKYTAWADALIERKCGRARHSIMPDQIRRLGFLLPEFAGDCEIDLNTPQMDLWRDALVNHIHSIELTEIPDNKTK